MTQNPKVALITGANGGIGREVSMGLASDGYALSLVARSSNRVEMLALEIMKKHTPKDAPLVLATDLTDPEKAERKLVEANRELITRMEAKIKAKLAEVWGEE